MKALVRKGMEALSSRALTSKKFKQRSGEVVVLMYHGVVDVEPELPDWCLIGKEQFESQIKFLKQHFDVVSLSSAVEGLKNGTIDKPTAVITFDDGYQNNHDVAFPILEAYQAPATIYVTTKYIDSDETLWTGTLQDAFGQTTQSSLEWRGRTFELSSLESKKSTMELIKAQLKKEHYLVIVRETLKIVDQLSGGKGFNIGPASPYRMLSSDMMKKMAKSDLIEFGAHTHSHPILSGLSKDEQEDEINKSIDIISEITGMPCGTFAYPNGRAVDYTQDTVNILEKANMYVSLSTLLGVCRKDTPLMEYRRFGVGNDTDFKRGLINMFSKY